MREQVAERYAAAAGEEREQDPEEDDHPVRRQARHEQGRRRGRVLCESRDGSAVAWQATTKNLCRLGTRVILVSPAQADAHLSRSPMTH